jgi:hypothetical protein
VVRHGLDEEVVARQAGVALISVGVEDPEAGPAARRAEAVPGDDHVRPLADDVPAEPDPRLAGELQAQAGRLGDRGAQRPRAARRLEEDEQGVRPAGQRRQPVEAVRDPGGFHRPREAGREVDDEDVDGTATEERAGDRQALVEVRRGHDDEPRQPDAPGDRLDRIEGLPHVKPGDDGAGRLGLRREAQRERRLAARPVTTEGEPGAARDAARSEDGVERREARRDDRLRRGGRRETFRLLRPGDRGERPDDLTDPPRSCPAPARLEGRQSRRHVRGERRHGRPQ